MREAEKDFLRFWLEHPGGCWLPGLAWLGEGAAVSGESEPDFSLKASVTSSNEMLVSVFPFKLCTRPAPDSPSSDLSPNVDVLSETFLVQPLPRR